MQNDQFKIMLQRILEGFEVCPYFPVQKLDVSQKNTIDFSPPLPGRAAPAPAAPRARPARAAARAAVKQEPVEPEAATGPVAQVAPVPEAPPEPPVEEPLSPCLRLEGAKKNQGKGKGGTTKAGEIAKKKLMFKKKNEKIGIVPFDLQPEDDDLN